MGGQQPGEFTYPFPRPAITVDTILITEEYPPQVLLIQRENEPWAGLWALPGGFVDEGEKLDVAAARELLEETSVDPQQLGLDLVQVGIWGDPGRDPRGWVLGICYACLSHAPAAELGVKAGDDARDARFFPLDELPLPLACDGEHLEMLQKAFRMFALTSERVQGNPRLKQALLDAAEGAK